MSIIDLDFDLLTFAVHGKVSSTQAFRETYKASLGLKMLYIPKISCCSLLNTSVISGYTYTYFDMDSYLLLVLSLMLIITLDFLLVCTYLLLIHFESGIRQFSREDLRQSFSPLLMILCLFQTVFLSVGFSDISDDINESYQSITNLDTQRHLSLQWKLYCVAIGLITIAVLVTLCVAIRLIRTTLSSPSRLPLAQIRYFWINHALLNVSAVFSIIISYQELPAKENTTNTVMVSLILSAFAIVTFELGFGIRIYAALYWLRA